MDEYIRFPISFGIAVLEVNDLLVDILIAVVVGLMVGMNKDIVLPHLRLLFMI